MLVQTKLKNSKKAFQLELISSRRESKLYSDKVMDIKQVDRQIDRKIERERENELKRNGIRLRKKE